MALKVLPAEFAGQVDLRERFLRETRTAASFSHPNIVPVFSIEDGDGVLAFAMGYAEGESVAELVKQAKQKSKQAFIYVNNRLEGNALETIAAMSECAA